MKDTVVIIGGSAGALIAEEIFSLQYSKILFLETYSNRVSVDRIIGNKILEGVEYIKKTGADYFIATGDNEQRKNNYELIYNQTQKKPVNCIHETAYISPSARLGFGNLICPNATIHINVVIGNNTIINTGSIVEHDCVMGDYSQLSPNATLSGRVELRELVFVGAGSVVIPDKKLGKNSLIAAGSAVITDVEENVMYAGVPAKFKKDL